MTGALIVLMLLLAVGVVGGTVYWVVIRPQQQTSLPPDAPRIEVTLPGGRTKQVALPPPGREVVIGREADCQIMIDSPMVSRRHARIVYDGQAWQIEDLNSVNHTFVNSRPINRQAIHGNDQIDVGPARMRLIGVAALHLTPPPQPGPSSGGTTQRQMFGNYGIIQALGDGGFNKVFLAQHSQRPQFVALKLIDSDDDYIRTKFKQEGALKLKHPGIAEIYEAGEVNGRAFIAMEFVEGLTLRRLLESGPLPIDQALVIAGQVLEALHYAHQHQVIHRDIKPENIMLSVNGTVKIIDFGIARVLSEVTRTQDGLRIGTPVYMSYEQAMATTVVPSSDLYSMAIVIYEMLTNAVPFSADNSWDVIGMHQRAIPQPPSSVNRAIPPAIDAAILQALQKAESERFANGLAFAQALGCPRNGQFSPQVLAIIQQHRPVLKQGLPSNSQPTRPPLPATGSQQLPRQALLRIYNGRNHGRAIPLTGAGVIGRDQIDLNDGAISREHLRFEQTPSGLVLIDVSSLGTLINGARIPPNTPIIPPVGCQIQVGQTTLIYENR